MFVYWLSYSVTPWRCFMADSMSDNSHSDSIIIFTIFYIFCLITFLSFQTCHSSPAHQLCFPTFCQFTSSPPACTPPCPVSSGVCLPFRLQPDCLISSLALMLHSLLFLFCFCWWPVTECYPAYWPSTTYFSSTVSFCFWIYFMTIKIVTDHDTANVTFIATSAS